MTQFFFVRIPKRTGKLPGSTDPGISGCQYCIPPGKIDIAADSRRFCLDCFPADLNDQLVSDTKRFFPDFMGKDRLRRLT